MLTSSIVMGIGTFFCDYKSKGGVKLFSLLIIIMMGSVSCQHARVTLPPPAPQACLVPQNSSRAQRLCEIMRQRQAEVVAKKQGERQKKVINQRYYLWGLYPKQMEYSANEFCNQGVYEIYQYTTILDGVIQNFSLGIVTPRTLEITCY